MKYSKLFEKKKIYIIITILCIFANIFNEFRSFFIRTYQKNRKKGLEIRKKTILDYICCNGSAEYIFKNKWYFEQ